MAWKLLESEEGWEGRRHRATYMVDGPADIPSPPAENSKLAEGSIAYTADLTQMWQKDGNGQWVKVGG